MTDFWTSLERQIGLTTGRPFAARQRQSLGGGCINAAWRVSDGERDYFVKANAAAGLAMFEAEAEGLAELAASGTVRVPEPVCWGTAADRAWLVLEYLPLGGSGTSAMAPLGRQLAALHVLILHMALGRRGRLQQIGFLAEQVRDYRHVILMGDLNCDSDSSEMTVLLERAHLCEPAPGLYTFPSWRPNRQLDHILVSSSITVERVEVLDCTFSDHLPIAMAVRLPEPVRLAWESRPVPVPALGTVEPIPVDR
jgi:hypothetical protein